MLWLDEWRISWRNDVIPAIFLTYDSGKRTYAPGILNLFPWILFNHDACDIKADKRSIYPSIYVRAVKWRAYDHLSMNSIHHNCNINFTSVISICKKACLGTASQKMHNLLFSSLIYNKQTLKKQSVENKSSRGETSGIYKSRDVKILNRENNVVQNLTRKLLATHYTYRWVLKLVSLLRTKDRGWCVRFFVTAVAICVQLSAATVAQLQMHPALQCHPSNGIDPLCTGLTIIVILRL